MLGVPGDPPAMLGMQQELLCSLLSTRAIAALLSFWGLSSFQVTLTTFPGFFLAVPCLDPPGLGQEPVPGAGGAAELAGPAAAGEQGLLLAALRSSHLASSLPRRWHRCWQQMDEQISSQAVPRQALRLGKFSFPFAKHLQGVVSRAEMC